MKNDIFNEVARMHGVTAKEVRSEIEKSITEACKSQNAPIINIGSGKVPTPEEVINHVLKELAKSNMN
ncbi:hypothetical protein [Ruminococcus sp.]|uniref:hypothetical protein n=1 Tax=Ruminococcus sp. TaxID=41978 RepID=UPI0025D96486|nr:hypothetical protein [Ruminococcus sp.]